MGEFINPDTGSVDFIAEKSQGDRGRGRDIPVDDFSDLGFKPQHHGGGASDSSDMVADASGTALMVEKAEDTTPSQDEMMTKFMAGGVGETTKEEDSAIAAKKEALASQPEVAVEEQSGPVTVSQVGARHQAEVVAKSVAEEVAKIHEAEGEEATETQQPPVVEPAQPVSIEVPHTETRASVTALKMQLSKAQSERDVALLLGLAVQNEYLKLNSEGKAAATTKEGEDLLSAAGKFGNQKVIFAEPQPQEAPAQSADTVPAEVNPKPIGWAGVQETVNPGYVPASAFNHTEDSGRDDTSREVLPEEPAEKEVEGTKYTQMQGQTDEELSPEGPELGEVEAGSAPKVGSKQESAPDAEQPVEGAPEAPIIRPVEATTLGPAEILEKANQAFRSELGQAIDQRIEAAEAMDKPEKANIILRTIWKLTSPKHSNQYEGELKSYNEAQRDRVRLEKIKSDWIGRESGYLTRAYQHQNELGELLPRLESGEITRKEKARLGKITNSLVTLKNNQELYLTEVIKEALPDDLKELYTITADAPAETSLRDKSAAEAPTTQEISQMITDLPRAGKLLQDMGPEYAQLFLTEQSGGILQNFVNVSTKLHGVLQEINESVQSGAYIEKPARLATLVERANILKAEEKRTDKAIEGSLRGYAAKKFWTEWGHDLIVDKKIKFAESLGLEKSFIEENVGINTELNDIIQNGYTDHARRLQQTIAGGLRLKKAAGYTAKGVGSIRKKYNQALALIYKDDARHQEKVWELEDKVGDLDVYIADVNETLTHNKETREAAEKRLMEQLIKETEFDTSLRAGVASNIIGELRIPDGSKAKLIELFSGVGFVEEFADALMTAIEQSKANAIREQAKIRLQLTELEYQMELLKSQEDVVIERADGSLTFADGEMIDEESEKLISDEEKMFDYERQINDLVISQIRALNDRVEKALLNKIRAGINRQAA